MSLHNHNTTTGHSNQFQFNLIYQIYVQQSRPLKQYNFQWECCLQTKLHRERVLSSWAKFFFQPDNPILHSISTILYTYAQTTNLQLIYIKKTCTKPSTHIEPEIIYNMFQLNLFLFCLFNVHIWCDTMYYGIICIEAQSRHHSIVDTHW